MTQVMSIFGDHAKKLQAILNAGGIATTRPWYEQYFNWAAPQISLSFATIIGQSRLDAVATVIDRNSKSPIRSREALDKLTGTIPAISEAFQMSDEDYRSFLTMQGLNIPGLGQNIIDLIYNDANKAGMAALNRLDIMALEAVSTGKISLTVDNNPDGIKLSNALDLFLPSENKSQSAVSWETTATSTPIADIKARVKAARAKGVRFAKILMRDTLFDKLTRSKEVIDTLAAFYYGPKPGGSFNPVAISTVDNVNNFLQANRLPVIEIVDQTYGIEKDGKIHSYEPFAENNVSFIPAGPLGEIKHALAIEEVKPVAQVAYAKYDKALISKWSENNPFNEFTKSELNACPSLTAIDSIYILEAVHA